jgi:acetyl-CoA acetyltransferase
MAMVARRYQHEHGATSEDFGRVAVQQRAYAAANPAAIMRDRPLTLEDHQASPWVSEPLRRFDCCLESDGAVAVVVTTLERARELGAAAPVVVAAAAQAAPAGHLPMSSFYEGDITACSEGRAVADQLWEQSGWGAGDIDAAILYDHFTPSVLLQLEAYGFCERGEAPAFVRDGGIGPDGALPVNTHGGLLSEAYVHGMNGIAEAVRQIRGTACNQVKEAKRVLVTGGMMVPTSGLLLAGEAEVTA